MKIKLVLTSALILVMSTVLAACGGVEDGKVTTENKGTFASTTASTTKGLMNEMSSVAEDVSEGLSEGMSGLKKGITRMYSER